MRIGVLHAAAAIAALAGWSCSESEDAALDFDLVEEVVEGTGPFSLSIDAPSLDTYFQTTRQSTSRLWVGSLASPQGPLEAKALLRFETILPEGGVVLADTLHLVCDIEGDYGVPDQQALRIERALADWYTDPSVGFPFDEHEPLDPDVGLSVGECNSTATDLDSLRVSLPLDLVQSWSDDAAQNHGIVIVPSSPGSLKRFLVSNVNMTIVYAAGGDTTRAFLTRLEHASIYTLDPAIEENGTGDEPVGLVGGAFDYRGVVRFDLAELPDDASIHKLDLRLWLDPAQSGGSPGDTLSVGFHQLVSISGEDLEPLPAVSFFSNPVTTADLLVPAEPTQVVVDISRLATAVQDGVLIKVAEDFPSLLQLGFATREGDPDRRPALDVVFTLPAAPRL